MKNLKKIWLSVAVGALSLCAMSCTEDKTIDPVVGVSATQINVTKRGVSYEGAVVNFEVKSNVFWMITNADEYDWLSVTPEAGYGTTTVQVRVDLNAEAPRTARLKIETRDGAATYVEINQASAEEVMTYLVENFGPATDSRLPIGAFQQWGYTGAGTTGATYRYAYEGENTFVSDETKSEGYEGASGGNNILFDGDGATFTIKNFNAQSERNFRMQFAATNTEGAFSAKEFKLQISKDNHAWFDMEYASPRQAGWIVSELQFNIPENMDCLFFRFVGKAGYLLDDVQITEGEESAQNQVFDFIYVAPGFRGLPASWDLATMASSDENGQSWITQRTIFSTEGQKQGSKIYYYKDAYGTSGNNVYDISGGNPRVTGGNKGDYWLFTLPVQNAAARTSVRISGTMRSSASGAKFYIVEYSTDGEIWKEASGVKTADVTCTNGSTDFGVRYHYAMNRDGATDTQINNTITFEEPVADGNLYIRLRISSAVNATESQLMPATTTSSTRLTGQWSIAEEKIVEGFPVYWSFPSDGATSGVASTTGRYCFSDDFAQLGMDAARIDAIREAAPSSNANMSYTLLSEGELGRLLMYGFALDDHWKFTVPVKHFKTGTKVNLQAIISSSPSGPKFYIAEYSADGGTTWKLGNTPKTIDAKADTDTETRTITYSYMMPDSPSNADCVVDETLTIAEAIDAGNLMLRLRVCDAMSGDKKKNIIPANGGTTRIKTKAGICERISVTIVE